jgi:hypothetical protein
VPGASASIIWKRKSGHEGKKGKIRERFDESSHSDASPTFMRPFHSEVDECNGIVCSHMSCACLWLRRQRQGEKDKCMVFAEQSRLEQKHCNIETSVMGVEFKTIHHVGHFEQPSGRQTDRRGTHDEIETWSDLCIQLVRQGQMD